MNRLNLSAYLLLMIPAVQDPNTQEAVGALLLESIVSQSYFIKNYSEFDCNKKTISKLKNQRINVPKALVSASSSLTIIEGTVDYFNTRVIPILNPHTADNLFSNLTTLIKNDSATCDVKRKKLIDFHDSNMLGEFLALTFLYAINRPNKLSPSLKSVKCPHCESSL